MQGLTRPARQEAFPALWGRGRSAQRCGRLNCFFLGPTLEEKAAADCRRGAGWAVSVAPDGGTWGEGWKTMALDPPGPGQRSSRESGEIAQ